MRINLDYPSKAFRKYPEARRYLINIKNEEEGREKPGPLLLSVGPTTITDPYSQLDFPSDASGKEPTCQCRRHKISEFDPWVKRIPWRRA